MNTPLIKNNRIAVALCLMLFLSIETSKAQYIVSGGIGTNTPNFNYSSAKTGFNIGVTGRYYLTSSLLTGLNIGFTSSKHENDDNAKIRLIPITALINQTIAITPVINTYVGLDAGIFFVKSKISTNSITGTGWAQPVNELSSTQSVSKIGYGGAPVLGWTYSLKKNILIDANIKYYIVKASTLYTSLSFQVGASYCIGKYKAPTRSRRVK